MRKIHAAVKSCVTPRAVESADGDPRRAGAAATARLAPALPLLAGLLVAETIGIIARELIVSPGAYPGPWFRLVFSDTLYLKAWLALTAASSLPPGARARIID